VRFFILDFDYLDFCTTCLDRVYEVSSAFNQPSKILLLNIYLKRYLTSDELNLLEVETKIPLYFSKECGCSRSHVKIKFVQKGILLDISSTIGFSRMSGIQNYIFFIIKNLKSEWRDVYLIKTSQYGYTEITIDLFFKSINVKHSHLRKEVKKFTLYNNVRNHQLYKFLKKYAFKSHVFMFVKNWILNLYFKNYTGSNSPMLEKTLLIPLDSIIWILDSVLDETRIWRLENYKEFIGNKIVSSIHDIMPLTNPGFFPMETRYKSFLIPTLINISSAFSVQSTAVRKSLENFMKSQLDVLSIEKSQKKIFLHHRPLNSSYQTEDNFTSSSTVQIPDFDTKVPQITWMSTIEPRKNLAAVLRTFEWIHSLSIDFNLNIIGFQGWNHEPIMKKIDSLVQNNFPVKTHLNAPDDIVHQIFKDTSFFIYSSYGEGLGLPLFDFLRTKKLVISNKIPVIDEFVLEASNLLTYSNEQELRLVTKKVLADKSYLENFGAPRLKDTTWRASVELILGDLKAYL
jgi:glycosyltransferase involved in cell wall biosynthesis